MALELGNLSVNPASGYAWSQVGLYSDPAYFAIPQSLSSADHTKGFEQQTFLGASIRSFSISAGFGDSVSTLNVELVNDEYNKSDETGTGFGDDPYHSGVHDRFVPPPVGSPVFFKFGKNKATTTEAYGNLYNQIYSNDTGNNYSRGLNHFCFGGILQSYVENRGPGGDPVYSVQVVDPREILSNITLIINDYAGSVYKADNVFNLYGFLEFVPSTESAGTGNFTSYTRDELKKYYDTNGAPYFSGIDLFYDDDSFKTNTSLSNDKWNDSKKILPITGTGYSRRSPQGIPYYRVKQALNALLGIYGALPSEYLNAGFAGYIKFRGLNYIVDLGGLPDDKIPNMYFIDFDQMNLLDFCLEICDITNHELFVTLLPIINHKISKRFYDNNQTYFTSPTGGGVFPIAGIIRIDTIDKSKQQQYGTIKSYLDELDRMGIPIENRDVGFELSNVPTDKFIVGAQEVDMYFFSGNRDRGGPAYRSAVGTSTTLNLQDQWQLSTMLSQQILPYYGMLGKAVTIPRGFGAYQQILLDASSLYAAGVGNYYVATEMELRAASISYEKWADFLMMYNDVYMESTEDNDALEGTAVSSTTIPAGMDAHVVELSRNYAVTVPRSVWPGFNTAFELPASGKIVTPIESCNPPFGYPLYYKRAEKLGVNGIGLAGIQGELTQIITDLASVYGNPNDANFISYLDDTIKRLNTDVIEGCGGKTKQDQYKVTLFKAIKDKKPIGLVKASLDGAAHMQKAVTALQKRTKENSIRVYNFLKKVADECLGKKFLVKIPRHPNLYYNKTVTVSQVSTADDPEIERPDPACLYTAGPFGFRPRKINAIPNYEYTSTFDTELSSAQSISYLASLDMMLSYLTYSSKFVKGIKGGLEINFNPITDEYVTNYVPEPQGGYVDFDLMANMTGTYYPAYRKGYTAGKQPLAVSQGLMPIDFTNLMNNNRLGAYVRFDHSESLAFDQLDSSTFTQQKLESDYFIPDISMGFDNLSTTDFSFPQNINRNEQTAPMKSPCIAFVKCDLDEKLYMPPISSDQTTYVYGCFVEDIGKFPTEPVKKYNKETCSCDSYYQVYTKHYVPTATSSTTIAWHDFDKYRDSSSNVVPQSGYKTSLLDLDTTNVYALITLPSKVVPKEDARFRDGPASEVNAERFKHLLTQDVVKISAFSQPNYLKKPPTDWIYKFRSSISPSTLVNSIQARKAAVDNLQFGFPQMMQAIAPSPVYPDLVVLPLRSNERCYGPWVSNFLSTNNFSNLGGRVDFIKDETLAPWNYNGYDLMNDAGRLKATFSNSQLLQAERGGVTIPAAPSGVYLGRFLKNVGPLLTNLNVDVSTNGIRSTLKFDLYSVSFGKLAKQKQEQISYISRERQKLRDERNALIRKGIGKNQSSISLSSQYNYMNTAMQQGTKAFSTIVLSTQPNEVTANKAGSSSYETFLNGAKSVGSLTNASEISKMMGHLEPHDLAIKYSRSASANISDVFLPVDQNPGGNPYLHRAVNGLDDDTYNSMYS